MKSIQTLDNSSDWIERSLQGEKGYIERPLLSTTEYLTSLFAVPDLDM